MAAIYLSHCFHSKNSSIKEHSSIILPAVFIPFSCQNRRSNNRTNSNPEKDKAKGNKLRPPLFDGVLKLGKELKESLSPKRKGDWKDLMLMSLSFAVYIYMSQQIVCAYCAWMSMLK
ncbi:hypothetical protein Nepgr_006248 [Nepenthes gracilis]|uniref:Uncharacterized protein n=1 Tax=Nepenthes gracilis TaxID=150966 RepID=A0AAD3XH60_NEPGR|nr:hypothetical protein Nepgr_006248 [Nepenthes gracilis]